MLFLPLPKRPTDFVKNLELYYSGDPYLFAVCTCGASAGKTMDIFEKALEENGLVLDSGFSVVMPDNCITLFEVDSEEEISEKFEKAEKTLDNILRAIKLGWSDFFRVKKGRFGNLLTAAVNPVFVKGMKTKPFYVTDACIGCGRCTKECEFGAIVVENGVAHIDASKCTACGKCANVCPCNCIVVE